MTAAIKNDYDTLTTDLRRVTDGGRTPRHYHERWLRRRGLLPRPGGGKIEKFRRIARYRTVTTEDILRDHMPRIAESEYHYYRWNVGILLCIYCGERLTRDSRTEDHVIPRCRGGGLLGRDNLEPACRPCNLAKGDLSLLSFLLSRREATARGVVRDRPGLRPGPVLRDERREHVPHASEGRAARVRELARERELPVLCPAKPNDGSAHARSITDSRSVLPTDGIGGHSPKTV